MDSKNVKMSIYIPSWDRMNNIGGILRTTAILDVSLYIGEKGNRGNNDRPCKGKITSRERKDIEGISQGVCSYSIVTDPNTLFDIINDDTLFILMETPDFWKTIDVSPISLYNIVPEDNMMFVFGNERHGISVETLKMFKNYIPCYLPQNNDLVNTRKRHNNVSLNLCHAAILTIGIMKGKLC